MSDSLSKKYKPTSSVGRPTLQAIVVVLGLLGCLATWGRTIADGSFALLNAAMADEHYTLPGTSHRPLRVYSGIPPLDYLARVLVLFFWEAIDGSHPKTSAAGIYMAGQMAPVIVTQYLDALRRGHGVSCLRPSLWWFVFASCAIGASGAAWLLVGLASSPTLSASALPALQDASLVGSPRAAALVLPATYLSFAGSMVVMALPAPRWVSYDFRQWAVVLWNLFPLGLSAIVHGGDLLWNAVRPPAPARKPDGEAEAHLGVVRWLGVSSAALGFAMHVAVAAVSVSAALFPALFAKGYAEALNPLELAVPPLKVEPAVTPGDGIWSFVVWDQVFGFSFMLLFFLAQLENAMRLNPEFLGRFSWAKASVLGLLSCFVVGPGATVAAVSLLRDHVLFYGKGSRSAKKTQNGKA